TGVWQSNKLLSGAVVVTSQPRLLWNAEVSTRDAHHLLQAGPRLVDAGSPVDGLDRKKHAARTFVANDGDRSWFFGLAEGVSLAELGEILATPGLTTFPVHRALNLDGGRSSALYYRDAEGFEHSVPGWSTVRNYLAIIPH
ncbi:MAG: phosphodiester glycosidase family protein, partial [Prosthecobacter sp.]